MASYVVKNNVESTIADNPLAQAATTLNVAVGGGANFPSTFPFLITLWDESAYSDPTDDSGMEIVKCTARTTDALTIVRAQEGTADVAHSLGECVAMLITAGIFNDATYGLATKLDGIEAGATADQTGAEIKTAYEGQANAYTDTKNTKLSGIATNATNDDLPTVEANDVSDDVGDIAQKCREFTMSCARPTNSIKLTWEQKADGSSDTIYACIYKNGVQVHSGFVTEGTTYQEKSKVLTDAYKIGDTIEIWVSGDTGSDHVYVRNAHLSYEHATTLATVTQGS